MQSQTKRRLSPGELDALLRASTGIGCRLESELTDGWFNTAYRVLLDDGRPAVVKLAPPTDAAVLRYELGIMATEAMVYRRIETLPGDRVPTPALRHRLALYRLYLSLLLVVECGPRGYSPDHLASCSRTLADTIAQLRALE